MSNYIKKTKNPWTGEWEMAEWKDDFFGQHNYGVMFPSNRMILDPRDTILETEDDYAKET